MPRALVFHHYFYPDDVVSSLLLSELCAGLVERGWDVSAMPCNRGCRDESQSHSRAEIWNGIRIQRIWRPPFKQSSSVGRALNALWMVSAWSVRALWPVNRPDVVIVGTDPVLSVLTSLAWKTFQPRTAFVHWCFDLYPEAAIADGVLPQGGILINGLRRLLNVAYRRCDAIVDIGSCMRGKLAPYGPRKSLTLTPWALVEPNHALPVDPRERTALFGDPAVAIMYSGNFGRAHAHQEILDLARLLREDSVRFVFSIRGNRAGALRADVRDEDTNVLFAPFARPEDVKRRLSAADILVVSLRQEWTGTVVPSKFFGALAVGRPVLFVGSPESAIAKWINKYDVGWVLTKDNTAGMASIIRDIVANPVRLRAMRSHCFDVYTRHFSRQAGIDAFDEMLRSLAAISPSDRVSEALVQKS